jgi:CTP synthase
MKFIVVTGGVLSGLGKGITTSSIGLLLKYRGLNVSAIKIDPYLNCDAGTMNPFQHGEVFVLDDGGEVDLDLGSYERFLDVDLTKDHNITTGKIYLSVIEKERKGNYLGQTVQIIPHITNEIKETIKTVAKDSKTDVMLIELGGTVGDIESMPFLEGVRQLSMEVGKENCLFVHTTLVPVMKAVGEQKTKPTQHSVKELRSVGLQPNVIVARGEKTLANDIKRKIALFCDVPLEAVISAPDTRSIYEVPRIFEEQCLPKYILERLSIKGRKANMRKWDDFLTNVKNPEGEVKIAVVGKYTKLSDSYLSHTEALTHAGAALNTKAKIMWVESEDLEKGNGFELLRESAGILVPGGFGDRGIEGKIAAIRFARENEVPFLGVCLGFQLAVIEFARNRLDLEGANSSEFDPRTNHPVIDLLPEQEKIEKMGATMRLGAYPVIIKKDTLAHKIYGKDKISERHRHRYEVNPEYIAKLEKGGVRFTGTTPDSKRMEILELKDHMFFVASQFHPEFRSRPVKPSPLHRALVDSAKRFSAAKGF